MVFRIVGKGLYGRRRRACENEGASHLPNAIRFPVFRRKNCGAKYRQGQSKYALAPVAVILSVRVEI